MYIFKCIHVYAWGYKLVMVKTVHKTKHREAHGIPKERLQIKKEYESYVPILPKKKKKKIYPNLTCVWNG